MPVTEAPAGARPPAKLADVVLRMQRHDRTAPRRMAAPRSFARGAAD